MYLLASYFAARSASLTLSFLPYEKSFRFFLSPRSLSFSCCLCLFPRELPVAPTLADRTAAILAQRQRATIIAWNRSERHSMLRAAISFASESKRLLPVLETVLQLQIGLPRKRRGAVHPRYISRVSLTGNHVIPRCYLLASADASRFFHYRNVFSTRARANGKVGGASRTFFERQFARHRERVRDATGRTNELRRMREKTFRPTNERTRQRARATTRNSCEDA